MDDYQEVTSSLFALWRYDQFPYFVGGEVVLMNSRGYVQTKEYGRQYRMNPTKVLPLEAGRKLLEDLKALKSRRAEALNAFNDGYVAELNALLAPVGVAHPRQQEVC